MNGLYRQVFTLDDTLHMHQTGTISSGDIFGPGTHMVFHLVMSHTNRDFQLFDGKHSSETATFVNALRFEYLDAFYQLQQIAQFGEVRDIYFAGG